jgi:hypothetical protein
MRNPPAAEILNEEVSNLLKRKIKGSLCAGTGGGRDGGKPGTGGGHRGYSRPIYTSPSMRCGRAIPAIDRQERTFKNKLQFDKVAEANMRILIVLFTPRSTPQ